MLEDRGKAEKQIKIAMLGCTAKITKPKLLHCAARKAGKQLKGVYLILREIIIVIVMKYRQKV